jgi:putative redox protein
MAAKKSAKVEWKGEDLKFHASVGSGYEFEMEGPATPQGGSPVEFLIAGAVGCSAIDILHIMNRRRAKVTGLEAEIVGTQAESDPHVFTEGTILYTIYGEDLKESDVERAIELSMTKYCSASIMLKRAGMEIATDYKIVDTVAS